MSDFVSIVEMLEDIKQRVEQVKDELGKLQAQGDLGFGAAPGATEPDVIPPSAPGIEIVGGEETDHFPDCCAVGRHCGEYECG